MEQTQEQQIQLTIAEAEKNIELAASLERLILNPDFKTVIEQAYFEAEPARLASLLGDVNGSYRWAPQGSQAQIPPPNFVQMTKNIQDDLHAVGALRSFFRVVFHRAAMSQSALQDIEDHRNAQAAEAASDEEAANGAIEA